MRSVLYDPHSTDKKTEAQRSEVTCLRSHSWDAAELGFECGQPGPRALTLNYSTALSLVGLSQDITQTCPQLMMVFILSLGGRQGESQLPRLSAGDTELARHYTAGSAPVIVPLLPRARSCHPPSTDSAAFLRYVSMGRPSLSEPVFPSVKWEQ